MRIEERSVKYKVLVIDDKHCCSEKVEKAFADLGFLQEVLEREEGGSIVSRYNCPKGVSTVAYTDYTGRFYSKDFEYEKSGLEVIVTEGGHNDGQYLIINPKGSNYLFDDGKRYNVKDGLERLKQYYETL